MDETPDLKKQVEDHIRAYIARTAKRGTPLADDDPLVEHGFLPSIRLLELVGFLEDEFEIRLRPVDLLPAKLATIRAIAGIVRDRLESKR